MILRQLPVQVVNVQLMHHTSRRIRKQQEVLRQHESSALIAQYPLIYEKSQVARQTDNYGLWW